MAIVLERTGQIVKEVSAPNLYAVKTEFGTRPPDIAGTWAHMPRHKSDLAGTYE